jgi:hypothetical protein
MILVKSNLVDNGKSGRKALCKLKLGFVNPKKLGGI